MDKCTALMIDPIVIFKVILGPWKYKVLQEMKVDLYDNFYFLRDTHEWRLAIRSDFSKNMIEAMGSL